MNSRYLPTALALACVGCAAPMPVASQGPSLYDRAVNQAVAYAVSVKQSMDSGLSEQQIVDAAKEVVQERLKDPASAQFRKVRFVPYANGAVVCGELNAKNSYGGYVGFKRFVASAKAATTEDTESGSSALNAGIDVACR